MAALRLTSEQVVLADGVRPATVVVDGGRIVDIEPHAVARGADDLGASVLMAGVIDAHVHVNEPGRTEWEGFASATRAAAAGGVTTLVDMPLNSSPVTTTAAAVEVKRAAAAGQSHVDVGLYGGLVPACADGMAALAAAGVLGIKAFLCPSGLDDFPAVGAEELERAMPVIAAAGLPLLVHAERVDGGGAMASSHRYADYLASRPPRFEVDAVELMISLCRRHRCRVHIVHLAAAAALTALRRARREGLPLTVETCPHYLTFDAATIGDGATLFKCAPPIRDAANRETLWQALMAGDIDLVASDHSPCPPAAKVLERGDFAAAWGGISSLQLLLAATWTEARRRDGDLMRLGRWLGAHPARLLGLVGRKGTLAVGADADLVVWDPEASFAVDGVALHHRHPLTPYTGRRLDGVVERTYLRGELVYAAGELIGPPRGVVLSAPTA